MTTESTIDMGPGTYAIPLSLFKENRLRVCSALKEITNVIDDKTYILLQGGDAINLYNTDVEYLFRQVSLNPSRAEYSSEMGKQYEVRI